ncbi:Rieske 2Fe-2S domain-containing protein [bacterium]|nr:Rieske 2Fe-2S domain-containing protein [bacterium]
MNETVQNDKPLEPQTEKFVKRSIFQRIFGICATKLPQNANCWKIVGEEIEIDLSLAEELSNSGGGIRIEGKNLPVRILIIKGDDGVYYAFQNRCTHGGRRLDPVSGGGTVQCCSMGRSTFDYSGRLLAGSAKDNIKTFPVRVEEGKLRIAFG